MIAIKEQMIQTSPLDLKGCACCALSFLIPAHAYSGDTPATITPLDSPRWVCPLAFGKRFHFFERTPSTVCFQLLKSLSVNLFASFCMEGTLSCEVHDGTDCVKHSK